jgi:hypothetical protein
MKKVIFILALALTSSLTFAQDKPLEITGSVDTYYKYDFAKTANIPTSFASDQNSLSIGMIDVALKKTTGKTSFVGELSFGPRGEGQSILNSGSAGQSFHIQNLYASYAASDKFTLTAGFMATFIGYEVISPLGNFNYSTSYLFTNGPFQNAGVKGTYAFSSKVSLMVGAFNDNWNVYQANSKFGLNAIGAQLTLAPVKEFTAYVNYLDGSVSGSIIDLTAAYQITPKFKLGINAADYSNSGSVGYSGIALYPSYSIKDNFALGLRAESFNFKQGSGDKSVSALTLTANLKSGGLTFIPEFRVDTNSNKTMFVGSDLAATKSASQFSLAAVYGF